MKPIIKIAIISVLLFFYGAVNTKITYAQCTYSGWVSQSCCNWVCWWLDDCDKEGKCWSVLSCNGCEPYDCGYPITYNQPNGYPCKTGGSAGGCFNGMCIDCDYDTGNYCINGPYYNVFAPYYPCSSGYKASNRCCGDDAGEYYKTGSDGTNACCSSPSNCVRGGQCYNTRTSNIDGTTACCPSTTDCVYQNQCYSSGYRTCVGSILASCSNGQVQQTTCQYGCNNGECIPGPMTNYRLSRAGFQKTGLELVTRNPTVGQDLEFVWNEQTPWPSNWYREGEILITREGGILLPEPRRVIHNLQVGASPQTVPTTGAQQGDYIAKIRGCNSAGCSQWAEVRFTLNPPLPQVESGSIEINPNPVRIGIDNSIRIRWRDPQGYGQP